MLGGMLAISLTTGAMAQPGSVADDGNQKKERVQILVVDKKNSGKSDGGGQSQQPRPADRNKKSQG